jgi:hypothetical protein
MELVMMMVLMERPPPTPRRSGDDNGINFPVTRGSGAAGSALSRSRRGLSPPPPTLQIMGKIWRRFSSEAEAFVKRRILNGARG